MKKPDSLNSNLLFLSGKLTKRLHEVLTELISENGFDVTVEQFSILSVLWYQDGVNQQYLADELDRDKTTIVRILNNMERNNLLVRVYDKSDKRLKRVYLTHKGKELQGRMIPLSGEVYLSALRGITEKDLVKAVGVLTRAIKNLGK